MKQHKISLAHVAISDLKCIEAHCNIHSKSPSSLLHHLESGTCVSKMDRDKLNVCFAHNNTDHLISEQSLALTTIEISSEISDSSLDYEIIYTPGSLLSTDSLSISHLALSNQILYTLKMLSNGHQKYATISVRKHSRLWIHLINIEILLLMQSLFTTTLRTYPEEHMLLASFRRSKP